CAGIVAMGGLLDLLLELGVACSSLTLCCFSSSACQRLSFCFSTASSARRLTLSGIPRPMIQPTNGCQAKVRGPSRIARWVMCEPLSAGSTMCAKYSVAPGSVDLVTNLRSGSTSTSSNLPFGRCGALLMPVVPALKTSSMLDRSTPFCDQSDQFSTSV